MTMSFINWTAYSIRGNESGEPLGLFLHPGTVRRSSSRKCHSHCADMAKTGDWGTAATGIYGAGVTERGVVVRR